jgi:DNA-binding MarR family transcriptional regulator
VRRLEQEEPLLPRILNALATESLTPTVLADQLGARKESVSRLLKDLRKEDLVEIHRVAGDRRRRRYALTVRGEVELRQHNSYGDPGPEPVELNREQTTSFLHAALLHSVRMRRQNNELTEAVDRQRKVLREARKIRDGELVLESMHELATTLRQQGEEAEVKALLDELEEVALGRSAFTDPSLPLQAAAHRSYALGRLGESKPTGQGNRANYLITALTHYCELAKGSPGGSSRKWRERQAWSAYSLAASQRSASQLDDSLRTATAALHLFEKIEDDHGRSHCLFLLGFLLRLLGDLDGASELLGDAHELASKGSYARLQVDSLMQIGEVYRGRGRFDEARAALDESRKRAAKMGLPVTEAFAYTALGAVAFDQYRWLEAQVELQRAQEKFKQTRHRYGEGGALNAWRYSVAARFGFKEAEHGNLKLARQLNDSAHALYFNMRRPAGVVACSIEHDRLRMCEGLAPEKIGSLIDLIDNKDRERSCLELDPWVPPLLVRFAEETENEGLVTRARQVLRSGEEKLKESLRQAMEILGSEVSPHSQSLPAAHTNEMGAETRELREESVPAYASADEEAALAGAPG